MKKTSILAVALTLGFMASLPGFAQRVEKADSVIGMVVTDAHNQRVGKVSELGVDLGAGRLAAILVDTGGYLTSNHRIVAVPPEAFVLAGENGGVYLNTDLDAFDNAPEFDMSAWTESMRPESLIDLYKRFHIEPYRGIGPVQRAGKLLGMTVRTEGNYRLGTVATIAVSLPNGQIPQVMIGSSAALGLKDLWTAVPPQAFIYNPARDDGLILGTTSEAFKNAPHFKPAGWRSAVGITFAVLQ